MMATNSNSLYKNIYNDVLNIICQYIGVNQFLAEYLVRLDKSTRTLALYPKYIIRVANKPFDRRYWYYEIREESTRKWHPLDSRGWCLSFWLTDNSFLLYCVMHRYQIQRTL